MRVFFHDLPWPTQVVTRPSSGLEAQASNHLVMNSGGVQIFHPFLNERELPNSEAIKQRLQPEGSYTISINTGNEQMDARDEEQHDWGIKQERSVAILKQPFWKKGLDCGTSRLRCGFEWEHQEKSSIIIVVGDKMASRTKRHITTKTSKLGSDLQPETQGAHTPWPIHETSTLDAQESSWQNH